LTPNDPYWGRTAPLTSKRCILYIHSTNIGTEYFKHGIYSLFFLQNAVCFIILTYLVPVLFIFYIQNVLKLKKKNNSGAERLNIATLQNQDASYPPLTVLVCVHSSHECMSVCIHSGACASVSAVHRKSILSNEPARPK